MRKVMLGMSLLAILLLPLQSLMAQATATPEQILAAEILNSDDDATNDVTDPTTITNAASVISAAPASAVQFAIAAVAAANPAIASQVAAAGAANNNGVSVAAAAASAGVTASAVAASLVTTVGQSLASGTSGTGTGSNVGGGAPSTADIEAAILENPNLISDILPGLSSEDVALLIEVIESGGSFEDFLASGPGV